MSVELTIGTFATRPSQEARETLVSTQAVVEQAVDVVAARAIATEYGRHGIRANTLCPGSVRTAS
jgi:enoyl-[acyl-carrier-protein] reductase (NADH)